MSAAQVSSTRRPPAGRVGEQPVLDLQFPFLAVPGVSPLIGEVPRTAATKEVVDQAAVRRSRRAVARAQAKASGQHDPAGQPYHSFRGLLEHLATLTRNQVRFAGTRATVPVLAEPTSAQREAFELIGAPIPLTMR